MAEYPYETGSVCDIAALEREAVTLALSVPGVAAPRIRWLHALGWGNAPRARVIRNRKHQLVINMVVAAEYGMDLGHMGAVIQARVREALERRAGLPVHDIRVRIAEVKVSRRMLRKTEEGKAT